MARNRRARLLPTALAPALLLLMAAGAPGDDQESWDAVFIAGSKVGYIHYKVSPVQDKRGRELLRVRVDTVLSFKRGDDAVVMQQQYGAIETLDGSILRMDNRTLAGNGEVRTHGDVSGGKMLLMLEAGGVRRQQELDWGPDVRGPYAAERSLSSQPIAPGESRTIKTFLPDLNKILLTHLVAKAEEPVELGGGERRTLLRVEGKVTERDGKTPVPGMETTYWVDSGGQILKSLTDVFGGTIAYRTTKAAAIAPTRTAAKLDLLKHSIVKVPRPIPNPERTRTIVYRVSVKGDDPTQIFPKDRRQSLAAPPGGGTATLTVRSAGPNDGPPEGGAVEPEYVRPNPLINSGDAKVVELMRKAVGGQTDPWAKAVAIEDWVAKNLKDKNFETAFDSASEVAKSLSGDCSEHSVLVAAMCRAAGIPARVVVGLVYAESLGGFGFHMWNEVFVNGRWVALDAAFNESDVDATHIKLSETSLDGVAPFETFMPVVRVFDKLTLEPVEIR